MRLLLLFSLVFVGPALAHEQEIHRALIERDQQSAEFAAGVRGAPVPHALHERQRREAQMPLSQDPGLARQLRPYQRERMAQDRELAFPPPVIRNGSLRKSEPVPDLPLPLPGGPQRGVDPVTPDGFRG
jgi:hypothetical protein